MGERRDARDTARLLREQQATPDKRHRPVLSVDTELASSGRPRTRRNEKLGSVGVVTRSRRSLKSKNAKLGLNRHDSGVERSVARQHGSERQRNGTHDKAEVQPPTIFITPSREVYEYQPPTNSKAVDVSSTAQLVSHSSRGRSKSVSKSRESTGTCFEEDLESANKARVTSGMTIFEEDITPKTSGWTPLTASSQRSKGWWNVITTPFATSATSGKFNAFSPSPVEEEDEAPEVPSLPPFVMIPAGGPAHMVRQRNQSPTRLGIAYTLSKPSSKTYLARLREGTRESSLDESRAPSRTVTQYLQSAAIQPEHAWPLPPNNAGLGIDSHKHEKTKPRVFTQDLSPYDREVPLMLGLDMASATEPGHVGPKNMPVAAAKGDLSLKNQTYSPASALTMSTPASQQSDFSPMVQIVPAGNAVAAKTLLSSHQAKASVQNAAVPVTQQPPDPTLSMRSSHTAQLFQSPGQLPRAVLLGSHEAVDRNVEKRSSFQVLHEQVVNMQETEVYLDAPPISEKPKGTNDKTTNKSTCTQKLRRKRSKHDEKKRRRRFCICCMCWGIGVLLLILLIVLLAVLLPRRNQSDSASSVWLNISGFPPVPTGVLTVARPNLVNQVSGCANPKAMWSCAVPKEQQVSMVPNEPDQPNFVFNIMYDDKNSKSSATSPLVPVPAVPLLEEQQFLGITTDGTVQPAEGEITPFYITFMASTSGALNNVKIKRDDNSTEVTLVAVSSPANTSTSSTTTTRSSRTTSTALSSADSFPFSQSTSSSLSATSTTAQTSIPNFQTAIPLPSTNPDGTALPANLLPFPSYQPLKLYNRGLSTEHYGFYTYFDRNIFMRSISLQNGSQQMLGDIPADASGGSAALGATARCTWRETRFRVQIWTKMANETQSGRNGTQLLSQLPASTISTTGGTDATTLLRPGSFPLPITITLDRHGGSLTRKMLYCYGLDERGRVVIDAALFQPETRSFVPEGVDAKGGLVNPALGPFTKVNVSRADGGPGGIDGGVGGCGCTWQNF